MRFESARTRQQNSKKMLSYLLCGLKSLTIIFGYLLIAKIAKALIHFPTEAAVFIAIFALSFAFFLLLDHIFKREEIKKFEFIIYLGSLLFFAFIWVMYDK